MRFLLLFVCLASFCVAAPPNPELLRVRSVYVMPMQRGMDQYLANNLVREGKYQVVTDAHLADAVLTDRIGPDFEQRFEELFAPKPEPEEEPGESESATNPSNIDNALAWAGAGPPRISSFSRTTGNLFLVDRGTKVVLWSAFRRPKNAGAEQLSRTADWLVGRLHDDRQKAEKKFPSGPVEPAPAAIAPPAPPDPAPAADPAPAPEAPPPAAPPVQPDNAPPAAK